ncbi:hypothetical protein RFI_22107 [Reticulomyxa filosa]|uniref:Uncharacterized protein n=1 Tax=Reticulomyxa filosa TaxID=46433 RepID=X6MP83_RETFI|nr:hypothetical protein RFI_22107 [Reticulomyxa filosa]|eukprot:ETO15257.1 hypothetical protein RFI_22107 [Reticulomyxa filosa]
MNSTIIINGDNLLFITYKYNNIRVFNLNTFHFIKYDALPTDSSISFHCLILNPENKQEQEMMDANNKKNNEIIECFCFVSMQDYQLNMMNITTLFNFANYQFVMILHRSNIVHMYVSMMPSYSLVDGMINLVLVLLFQNWCTSIQFEKTNG